MKIKKNVVLLIDALISLLLIAAIFYFMDIEKLIVRFLSIDVVAFALSVIFLLILYVIMAIRIEILLKESIVNIGVGSIIRSHWVGMLVADFTPARSGYFATAAMLHYNYGVPSEKALVSIFGPQIFDFSLKVIAGTAGILFILWNLLDTHDLTIFLSSVAMGVIVLMMLLILFSPPFLRLFSFCKRFPFLNRMYMLIERMQNNSHIVVKKTPEILILLLLGWSAKAISWYFVAKAVGITLTLPFPELFFYFFFQPLVTMLEFLPLPTIAGTGASEAAGIFVMLLFGIPKEASFSFMMLARLKTVAVNLLAVPDVIRLTKTGLQKLF